MDYDRIAKERELYFNYSTKVATQENYKIVYYQASDSIKYWVDHDLRLYSNERVSRWFLDSLICFNKNVDKLIAVIGHQNILFKDIQADGLTYFYGVKVRKKWYFFKGPYVTLPRNIYQKDTKVPLSFSILKAIAIDEIFKGYLKKNKQNGKWEINDGFFKQLDYSQWGFFDINGNVVDNSKLTQAQLDSHLLAKAVFSNWKHIDSTKYEPLQ